jgi:hypothetical protein
MRKVKDTAPLDEGETEKRPNPRSGSSFDDFLRDEGIFDETHEKASDRARNDQIEDK